MAWAAVAIGGATLVGGYLSSSAQKSAASEAAGAQTAASQAAIEEQRREFDAVQEVLSPYIQAGIPAVNLMRSLAGIGGPAVEAPAPQAAPAEPVTASGLNPQQYQGAIDSVVSEIMSGIPRDWGNLDARPRQEARIRRSLESLIPGPQESQPAPALPAPAAEVPAAAPTEQEAIAAIRAGPEFQALTQQGEEAILQNASATGGLRGGNVQGALAKFRPQILAQLINERFNRLGEIARLGQASATGQAAGALQTGSNIANLLGQQGAAQAGRALAVGQANANLYSGIADTASNIAVLKALKVF